MMVKQDNDDAADMDEGWWSSVLADEESYQIAHKEPSAKQNTQPVLGLVDWERVQTLFEQDEIVHLEVHGFNRGGLLVQGDGIQGFVPISHLVNISSIATDEDRRNLLTNYVGKSMYLKIIECEPSQERIVLSERAAQAGEGRRKQLFESLKPGAVVSGQVTNVTDFGAFIDLGGVEGLIHVSELSWGRVQHPTQVLVVGQQVDVLILQVSEENSRIALSLKRLQDNPWELLIRHYQPGDVAPAEITTIMRFGAFARLEEGVEGLIHISSIAGVTSESDLKNLLQTGQAVSVRILHVDVERRRLGLGIVLPE
jgi:small subunit ribosomal protein S1